jgi:hypothetical protein
MFRFTTSLVSWSSPNSRPISDAILRVSLQGFGRRSRRRPMTSRTPSGMRRLQVETLAELTRERLFERMLLRGLSGEDVRKFIEAATGIPAPSALVAAIHRQTEGNALFVAEFLRLLMQDGELTPERLENRQTSAGGLSRPRRRGTCPEQAVGLLPARARRTPKASMNRSRRRAGPRGRRQAAGSGLRS